MCSLKINNAQAMKRCNVVDVRIYTHGNLLNAVVYLRSIVFRIAQTSQILFNFIFLAVLER